MEYERKELGCVVVEKGVEKVESSFFVGLKESWRTFGGRYIVVFGSIKVLRDISGVRFGLERRGRKDFLVGIDVEVEGKLSEEVELLGLKYFKVWNSSVFSINDIIGF